MKTAFFAALASLMPIAALAADFPLALDKDKPVATITIPDEWKPKLGEHGVEGTSPDGTSSVIAKIIKPDEKEASAYNDDTTAYIEEQGVKFPDMKPDADPKTTDSDTKINGLDAFVSQLDEATTYKGTPTTLTYYAIPFGETQTLNIITRGAKGDKAVAAIVATVKSIK